MSRASMDTEVMEIDIPRAPELQILNKRNKEGDTALHIACKEDKPDCVSVLLCAGKSITSRYGHYQVLK